MVFLAGLFTLIAVILLHFFISRREQYKLSGQLEGPFSVPIFGNVFQVIRKSNHELLEFMVEIVEKTKTMYRIWLGPNMYVFVTRPEDVKEVLSSSACINRDQLYDAITGFMGGGLFNARDHEWRDRRKFLNPCFNMKQLRSFMPIFNKESDILVEILDFERENEVFNVYKYIDRCSLDTVCGTTMGVGLNIQRRQNFHYLDAVNSLCVVGAKKMLNPFLQYNPFYRKTSLYREERHHTNVLNGFVEKIFHDKTKKMALSKDVTTTAEDTPLSYKTPQIFMDSLMKLYTDDEGFTDQDVINEVKTILFTGYESTASTISYVIFMLALHADVQRKVFEEVMTMCPNLDGDVQFEQLHNLEYFERVIKETMRLFPIVPIITRYVKQPTSIGNYMLPRNSHVLIPTYAIHRNSTLWGPNATQFDPDRFSPERMDNVSPWSYLPFGGGPRNCIGLKYAGLFMKTVLIKLVRVYEFDSPMKFEEIKASVHAVLKLESGTMVSFRKRQHE